MATSNSDAEKLRYFRASCRNARKINRSLQTQSEKLERWLDRNVTRKARVDREKVEILIPMFDAIKSQYLGLEKALADVISVASY
jgi:hypothetical protein